MATIGKNICGAIIFKPTLCIKSRLDTSGTLSNWGSLFKARRWILRFSCFNRINRVCQARHSIWQDLVVGFENRFYASGECFGMPLKAFFGLACRYDGAEMIGVDHCLRVDPSENGSMESAFHAKNGCSLMPWKIFVEVK